MDITKLNHFFAEPKLIDHTTNMSFYEALSARKIALFDPKKHVMVIDTTVDGGELRNLSKFEAFILHVIHFFGCNRAVSFDATLINESAKPIRALNPLLSNQYNLIRSALKLPTSED